MEKTVLTKYQFLKLTGLLTLAEHHSKKFKDIERSIAQLLDIQKDEYESYGLLSDIIYGDENFDVANLLLKLDLKVNGKELENFFEGIPIKTLLTDEEVEEKLKAKKST